MMNPGVRNPGLSGIDPQSRRNQLKCIWDSSIGARKPEGSSSKLIKGFVRTGFVSDIGSGHSTGKPVGVSRLKLTNENSASASSSLVGELKAKITAREDIELDSVSVNINYSSVKPTNNNSVKPLGVNVDINKLDGIRDKAKARKSDHQSSFVQESAIIKTGEDKSGSELDNQNNNSSRRKSSGALVANKVSFFENSDEKKRTKKTSVQVKISFAENATTTFEYEGEESALQSYLQDHPEEKEEVLKQEQEMNGVSSPQEDLLNDHPPRVPSEPDTSIKVNTILGHTAGALTSYKSKMQTQEFQFGMQNMEQDLIDTEPYDNETTEQTSMHILPAGESEVDQFSAETSVTDMLF